MPKRRVKDAVERILKFPAAEVTKKIDKSWSQEAHDKNIKKEYKEWLDTGGYPHYIDPEDVIEDDRPFGNCKGIWSDVADHIIRSLTSAGFKISISTEDDGTTESILKQDSSVTVEPRIIEEYKPNYRGYH